MMNTLITQNIQLSLLIIPSLKGALLKCLSFLGVVTAGSKWYMWASTASMWAVSVAMSDFSVSVWDAATTMCDDIVATCYIASITQAIAADVPDISLRSICRRSAGYKQSKNEEHTFAARSYQESTGVTRKIV